MRPHITLLECLLLFAFLFCIPESAAAQQTLEISGKVTDTLNADLPNVTITLMEGLTVAKKMTTDAHGDFKFKISKKSSYKLVASLMGYHDKSISLADSLANQAVSYVLKVILKENSQTLNTVSISTQKVLVTRKVDRLSYNVRDDASRVSSDMVDILKKVPIVQVGVNDKISINGKNTFKILINGKPSAILSADPSTFLRNMRAIKVERVEVITTPPARFSQSGVTEVINIITTENNYEGFEGTLRSNLATLNYFGQSFSGEYKKGRLGITNYVNLNASAGPENMVNEQIFQANGVTRQFGTEKKRVWAFSYIPELSYEIDSLNLILANVTWRKNQMNARSAKNVENDNSFTSSVITDSRNTNRDLGYSVYYQHQGKKNRERLFTAGFNYGGIFRDVLDKVNIKNDRDANEFSQSNNTKSKESTVQLDYARPIANLITELGGKFVKRDYISYADEEILNTNQWLTVVYNSYYFKRRSWGLKGGLRLEKSNFDRQKSYTNLIPSVDLQLLSKKIQVNLEYDQEIERPAIWQLNTFLDVANPNFINQGNPNLNPSLTHKFELSFSTGKKHYLSLSPYFYFTKNGISSVARVVSDSTILLTYENIGKKSDFGINTNLSYKFNKSIGVNLSARTSHVRYSFDGRSQPSTGYEFFSTMNINYASAKGYRINLYSRVSNPYILAQGKGFWWIENSLSLAKRFFKNKFNTSLVVENLLNRNLNRSVSFSDGEAFALRKTTEPIRQLRVSLSYNFGELKSPIKRTERQIINTDVKPIQ